MRLNAEPVAQRSAGVAAGHRHITEQDRRAHVGRVLLASRSAATPRRPRDASSGARPARVRSRIGRSARGSPSVRASAVRARRRWPSAIPSRLRTSSSSTRLADAAYGPDISRRSDSSARSSSPARRKSWPSSLERVLPLGLGQVRARGQVLMDADARARFRRAGGTARRVRSEARWFRGRGRATSTKASMAWSGCSLSRKLRPLEIRAWQRALFADQLAQVEPRRHPAKAKDKRQYQQPPGFKHHGSDFRADYVIGNAGLGLGRHGVRRHRHACLGQRAARPVASIR